MKALLIILLNFLSLHVFAKEVYRGIFAASISGGAMNYLGDLDQDLTLKFTKSGFGIHLTTLPYDRFNFTLNYVHGNLACDDAKAVLPGNTYRNLSFYSTIDEISLNIIFRFRGKNKSFNDRRPVTPYVFAGVGYFHFNPKRKVNGVEYELHKIGTEGQHLSGDYPYPEPYKLWQFNVPFGGGVKFKLFDQGDLGLECGLRKSFTDYIDDVSDSYPDKAQMLAEKGVVAHYLTDPSNDPRRPNGRNSFVRRGDPEWKDWYIYTSISFSYYFTAKYLKSRMKFATLGN